MPIADYESWLVGPVRFIEVPDDTLRAYYDWPGRSSSTSTWTTWTTSSSITTGDWHPLTWEGRRLTYGTLTTGAGRDSRQPTPEELQRNNERIRQQQIQREANRVTAQSRAIDLLLTILPPEQHQRYRENEIIEVVGSHGNLYRIYPGSVGNVHWIKSDGTVGGRLCAHPDMVDGWLPNADIALAQMLALQTNEAEFVRKANVHAGERPPIPRRRLRELASVA